MKETHVAAFLVSILMIAIVAGCGGSSEDLAGPAKEAVAAAGGKSPEELEKRIEGYKQLITDKEAELTEIAEKLKGMSPADLAGSEAELLKEKSEALDQQIEDIKGKIDIATRMLDD